MHYRHLDLNLLVALDALLTERNITEAGKRVCLTQSAMSGALARLREYFGDELLVQMGRRMVPTPLAESLAPQVRDTLLKIKTIAETKPGFDPATSTRQFSLMMSDYCSTVLMTEVLPRLERLAPGVRVEVPANNIVEQPTEYLERGDIDFLVMPQDYLADGHPREVLFEDDYACVVWKDNPLVGERITAEQYLEMGHVVQQFSRGRAQALDEWFLAQQGIARRIEIVALSFNAIPQCVVGTHRIATVHRRLAEFYARYLPLRVIEPPFELPRVTEAVQWHRYFDADPGTIWFRKVLQDAANQVGAI